MRCSFPTSQPLNPDIPLLNCIPPTQTDCSPHFVRQNRPPAACFWVGNPNPPHPCTSLDHTPPSPQPRIPPPRIGPFSSNKSPHTSRQPKPSPSGSVFGGSPSPPHPGAPLDRPLPSPQPRILAPKTRIHPPQDIPAMRRHRFPLRMSQDCASFFHITRPL